MAELVKISTPVGKLMWVNISGEGKLNYNEDGREYTASLVLSLKAAKPLITAIDEVCNAEAEASAAQSVGYRYCNEDGTKPDDGVDTGFLSFNFKTGTTFKDGKKKKIAVYNSNAAKVDLGDARVGNGTLGAISGSMRFYSKGKAHGVSLWLNSIQITKFEEYIEDAGFEAQDGDFEGVDSTGFVGNPANADYPEDMPTPTSENPADMGTAKPQHL